MRTLWKRLLTSSLYRTNFSVSNRKINREEAFEIGQRKAHYYRRARSNHLRWTSRKQLHRRRRSRSRRGQPRAFEPDEQARVDDATRMPRKVSSSTGTIVLFWKTRLPSVETRPPIACVAALIGVSARERARRPFCQVRDAVLSFSLSLSLSPRGKADKRVLFLRSD